MVSGKHVLFITIVAAPLIALIALSPWEKPGIEDIELSAVTQIAPTVQINEIQETVTLSLAEQKTPTVEEVAQIVNDRNTGNTKRLETFKAEGWKEVKVDDPPDDEVMRLSLNLLGNREEELQAQIQSNSFTHDTFARLTEIALTTTDEKTRYVALEALGRSGEKNAQLQLTEVFEHIQDEETRSQILGYLSPSEPDDEIAIFLTEQLADPNISERLKKQAAFPLAMSALLETEDPEEAKGRMSMEIPEEWSDRFSNIVNLIATGGL